MRILICGSRDFTDYSKFCSEMDNISEEYDFDNNQPVWIIAGEARGADALAKQYAAECDWGYMGFPADWKTYGKRAGPIRNAQMLTEGKPELVVAFMAVDSIGTKHMVKIAKEAGVTVRVVDV